MLVTLKRSAFEFSKTFIILIFLTTANCTLNNKDCLCQWVSQYPYTLGLTFFDVEFINKNTGWVTGIGKILKTTNAGINWVEQIHPAVNKPIVCIHPVDSNVVYAGGDFETILKTTNGGTNWTAIRNGSWGQGKSYRGLFFINQNTGWFCGSGLYVLKTTDGGATFDSTYIWWGYLFDMYFKDANTGLMVGEGGGIFKTTNSGLNWIQASLPIGNYGDIFKLSVLQNQYCYVVESAKRVFRSTNFGDSWDSIAYISQSQGEGPRCVRFSSLNTGWLSAEVGRMAKTTDGGYTWRDQFTGGDPRGVLSFWFYNDSIGWAVGSNGMILNTTSSGAVFVNNYSLNRPEDFVLHQNYPNPFNSETLIEYQIKKASYIELSVYNIRGQKIDVLMEGINNVGSYKIRYNPGKISSGIYFIELKINGNYKIIKRMIMIK